MELRQMRYLCTLADEENLNDAAKRLFITPQALGKAIRQMEEEIGISLFYREHGKLKLTALGKIYNQEYKQLLSKNQEMENRLANAIRQENHHIRVAISHGVLQGSFKKYFDDFLTLHPEITIDFTELPDLFVETMVENEDCDLGIAINAPHKQEHFNVSLLAHYKICAVVTPNHPLARFHTVTLRECANYPIATKNRIFKIWDAVEQCAQKQNIHLNYALSSTDEIAWRNLVERGEAIGIGTMYYANRQNHNPTISIPFQDDELSWDITLITSKNHYLSHSTLELQSFLTTKS